MEALIWQADSADGADHGQSCAAFASLTLALGAQAVGQQSWATGGGSYPWPLHQWADVRVQPNPDSPDVVSMLQDAQAHHRWHPLGDGYRPQPGDWVLFDGHVEVVTRYTGAALYTVGGDSLPNLTVNAHKFPAPLAAQGVLGFVNNGDLVSTAGHDGQSARGGSQAAADTAQVPGAGIADSRGGSTAGPRIGGDPGSTAVRPARRQPRPATSRRWVRPGRSAPAGPGAAGTRIAEHASQPAAACRARPPSRRSSAWWRRAAIAAQQRYGVPAAVTIAQAIDESGWGQSELATADHNLFGIKGTGPAGSHMWPTQEYENGVWVTRTARSACTTTSRRASRTTASCWPPAQAYQHAMADRQLPDAFADRPDRRLRHRSELRLQPDRADAAVQPVPLRFRDAGRSPRRPLEPSGDSKVAPLAAVPGVSARGA